MAQLVVRKLEESVKERPRKRPARNGHSMEEEAREILRAAVAESPPTGPGLGTRIAATFAHIDPPFVLSERRFEPVQAFSFDGPEWFWEDPQDEQGDEGKEDGE